MTHKKTIRAICAILLLAVSACSSNFSGGAEPPHDKTVVVEPTS